MKEIINIK